MVETNEPTNDFKVPHTPNAMGSKPFVFSLHFFQPGSNIKISCEKLDWYGGFYTNLCDKVLPKFLLYTQLKVDDKFRKSCPRKFKCEFI